jgi:hypothetical protein
MKFRYFAFIFSAILGCLYYLYRYSIVENYSYLGYSYSYNFDKIIISIISYVLFLYFLKEIYRNDSFTFTLVLVFFVFSTMPFLIFYSFSDAYTLPLLGHFAFIFFNYIHSKRKMIIPKIIFPEREKVAFIVLLLIIGISAFFATYQFNFSIGEDIQDVYIQRKVFSGEGNILTGYLYSPYANIICPFIIYYGVENKIRILTIIGFLFGIYLGLITGLKSTFLNLAFITIFYFFNGTIKQKILGFSAGILIALSICVYVTVSLPFNIVTDLLVRRTMFTNPLITNGFFVLFENEKMYWQHSVLKGISNYNGIHPNYIVGNYLFGKETETNANTGIIADGYANFGIIGILVFTYIVSYVIFYIKSLNVNHKYIGIYIIMIMASIEMELTVMFFTHGLLFLIILSNLVFKRSEHTII